MYNMIVPSLHEISRKQTQVLNTVTKGHGCAVECDNSCADLKGRGSGHPCYFNFVLLSKAFAKF